MASPARSLDLSLLPIFLVRLRTLKAIAPGLNDLSQSSMNELRSLLERAEQLVAGSLDEPVLSEFLSAHYR
jgi:hypothetical protein